MGCGAMLTFGAQTKYKDATSNLASYWEAATGVIPSTGILSYPHVDAIATVAGASLVLASIASLYWQHSKRITAFMARMTSLGDAAISARAAMADLNPFMDQGLNGDAAILRPYAAKLASMIAVKDHTDRPVTNPVKIAALQGMYVASAELNDAINRWRNEFTKAPDERVGIRIHNSRDVSLTRGSVNGADIALDMNNVTGAKIDDFNVDGRRIDGQG